MSKLSQEVERLEERVRTLYAELERVRKAKHLLESERSEVFAEREAIEALEAERDELAARFPDPTRQHTELELWQQIWLTHEHSDIGYAEDRSIGRCWHPHPKPTETRQEGLTLAEVFEAKPDGETCWAEHSHDRPQGRVRWRVESDILQWRLRDEWKAQSMCFELLTGWTLVRKETR